MIKLLRRFLDWLEMRFPAKVTLTEEDFSVLRGRIAWLENEFRKVDSGFHQSAIMTNNLSLQIAALKEGIVKGDIRPALSDAQKQRQEFVEGNFSRTRVTRQELENLAKK